ncbi:MAG TPA: DNA-3-methyladenine glycosylase [Planococcus sp. (in: firmicutes)]|nr:DNA-3-methyladenine glycosylase [Planococcus sp. (in: firmicutes)]
MRLTLPFQYDFDSALLRMSKDPLNAVDLADNSVQVPLAAGNLVTVKALGSHKEPAFEISGAEEGQRQGIMEIFHFHQSLDPIYEHFKGTSLSRLFDEHRGTPIVREFSLYAALMKSIIHQQLNMAFAHTLTSRFVKTYGHEKSGVWFYPSPEKIAQTDISEFREMQFSTRKAEYIIGLSKAIADGRLDLEGMRFQEDDEIRNELIAYRGIGPWTAENFLLFGLGRPNLFPLADIGLQNALKIQWNLEMKPKADEILPHLPEWSPYLSYAALYLWRSIE